MILLLLEFEREKGPYLRHSAQDRRVAPRLRFFGSPGEPFGCWAVLTSGEDIGRGAEDDGEREKRGGTRRATVLYAQMTSAILSSGKLLAL